MTTSVAKKIIWPYGTNQTVYSVWEEKAGEIDALGAQSDYTAFLHRGGIASIDLGTTRAPMDPIYHTHSNYDSYHWMNTFCDPGFLMHKSIGQYLTLFLYHVADDASLPLEPADYGPEMRAYFSQLQEMIDSSNATSLDVQSLENSIAAFEDAAQRFNSLRESAVYFNSTLLSTLNHKARDFSRGFISQGGLPNRNFYQHLVFAPGLDTGYAPVMFPGITEAVVAGNLSQAEEYVKKTVKAILAAAETLKVEEAEEAEGISPVLEL